MIERYTRPEMAKLWTLQNKFETWLKVEIYACEAWEKLKIVPEGVAERMWKNAKFTVERIDEIEQSTHHDVVAFTRCVAESLGDDSKYLHYGLTSTDVVDTALGYIMVQACDLLEKDINALIDALAKKAVEYKDMPCMGRTHGIHAEPTTFGLKFLLWHSDMKRNQKRLNEAKSMIAVGKLSGAVGNYGNIDPFIEQHVCENMGLEAAPISTQVLQRDRIAQLMCTIAIIGGSLEKMATEIRHYQRTELREAEEPFAKGQKGSSTMPHKRNPIKCENVCGLSRVLRGYAVAALEDIALWHERDISHSSAERVILADGTTVLDYMLFNMTRIIEGLNVYPQNMLRSMSTSNGLVYSQRVMLALVAKGMLREKAYDLVQAYAMQAWENNLQYFDVLMGDESIREIIGEEELKECFKPEKSYVHIDQMYKKNGLL